MPRKFYAFSAMAATLLARQSVILTVSVHNATTALVPKTFVRLENDWIRDHTCIRLLERLLREHDHASLADQLLECTEICPNVARLYGVQNSLGCKRSRLDIEIVATTFLHDSLCDTLAFLGCDELSFIVTPPPPSQRPALVDATATLMTDVNSRKHLPPQKNFSRMGCHHHLYNAILTHLEKEGMGWSHTQLEYGNFFGAHHQGLLDSGP